MSLLRHLYRLQKMPINVNLCNRRIASLYHSLTGEIVGEMQKSREREHQMRSSSMKFRMGFHKSSHSLEKAAVVDELMPGTRERIDKDTEKICRIVSLSNSGIEASLSESGIEVSSDLVTEVLRKLTNAGMLALMFFRWAERQHGFKHSTESFHHLIETLGKIKQFKLIWSLVEAMEHSGLLTKETFALIVRRYARARKIKEAIEAFEKMEMFGLKPELSDYNILIDTISKSKHVKKAEEIFNEMKMKKGLSPDLKTYSILLEGWGHEQDLPRMRAIYRAMIAEGFKPDVVTYGILINAYCRSGRCEEAMNIFEEMKEAQCKPSPHIFCTLINGLGSRKRLGEALKYFDLLKTSGFSPELPTYNAVVSSYCWALQFEDAFGVVEEMRQCGIGPNPRTYDIILHHLIKAGRTEEAYRVFQSMGVKDKCEPELNTYTMMVKMFCTVERVDMALKVWKQMSEKGIFPCMHMFAALINGLCYENRLEDACQYFQEMLDMGIRPPGQLFSSLKEALLDGGKRDLALDLSMKLDRLRKTPLVG